ncbi:Sulfotransferase family protein [Fontimonas thermophila]|uniref:Sulfotransferase family protein n=1 Tax=Fontimonas thermophila TaxID=1076937 RepID=A0A1I2J0E4_9GAMM|nr:sulfotransferase family 2 domain-containing protein [Fontimonas thermophila]SFF47929.1 Sulfotransferase family protein [Fontimonas thermophila]
MILSNRYNFLYVHIAKTGGTSVRAALRRLQWKDPYYLAQFICSRLSHMTGHRIAAKLPRHAKIICAQEMLPKEFFDGLFKFAFVRNPWDLQVSSYHHLKRERPHLLAGHESFEAFTRWKLDPQRPYQYHLDTSITLQTDYLIDLHGRILTDFIGRYETLHEDFAHICKIIGVPPIELPHKRQATDRKKDYRSYYSDDLAELVGKHFARDIELLGYRFDPV